MKTRIGILVLKIYEPKIESIRISSYLKLTWSVLLLSGYQIFFTPHTNNFRKICFIHSIHSMFFLSLAFPWFMHWSSFLLFLFVVIPRLTTFLSLFYLSFHCAFLFISNKTKKISPHVLFTVKQSRILPSHTKKQKEKVIEFVSRNCWWYYQLDKNM